VEGLSPGYAIPTTTTLLPLGGTSDIRVVTHACLIRATAHFICAIVRVRTIVYTISFYLCHRTCPHHSFLRIVVRINLLRFSTREGGRLCRAHDWHSEVPNTCP